MFVFQANERNAIEVFELQNACYDPKMRERLEVFESILANGGGLSVAAACENQIVGYALAHAWRTVDFPPDLDAVVDRESHIECCFIHDLAVAPDWRGRGVARALFEAVESRAAGLPMSLVAVNGSVPFWERFGFRVSACERSLESYPDRDAKLMVRRACFFSR